VANKYNCWEFMKCGREMGGDKTAESGVCPVAAESAAHGLNGGINAGRICWVVAGNSSKGTVKCSDSHGEHHCFQCEFRYKVTREEGLLNICKATGALLPKASPADN
jgi:hypothetical protein